MLLASYWEFAVKSIGQWIDSSVLEGLNVSRSSELLLHKAGTPGPAGIGVGAVEELALDEKKQLSYSLDNVTVAPRLLVLSSLHIARLASHTPPPELRAS